MASSRQEYFILRTDVPIGKTNNFLKNWLLTLNADHVLKGELLVKGNNPHDGSHAMYSLASDRSKKVSCINNDVAPLSKDDYEWLAAIQKPIDRFIIYTRQGKFEVVKKLQVGERVWVSLPASDGTPLLSSFCCQATVQYIGPLQDMPGRWVGVELKMKHGSCDGSYRDSRYFICEDGYGAFLSAGNILAVSQSTSAPPVPTTPGKKVLVSFDKTKTKRDFYLDDRVVVFDKYGKRVEGVAKWAFPGKEYGVDDYIIGIETDMPIKKEKIEEHINGMGHLFDYKPNYKKHTYLAVPEISVLKEGEGTPVSDVSTGQEPSFERKSSEDHQVIQRIPPRPVSHNLEVGSAVKLVDPPGYGTIRWIGRFPGVNQDIAGVELDRMDGVGDGSWGSERYFSCKDGHALFIVLSKLKPDSRFVQLPQGPNEPTMQTSCSCECQLVKDEVSAIKANFRYQEDNVKEIDSQLGEYKGQLALVREELATVKGQVVRFQEDDVTEMRQVREELATVRGQVVSCEEAKNQQIQELQQTIAVLREEQRQRENAFTARLSAIEAQMRALQPPWAISETELEVTKTVLGKGAYGEVRVGVYHGDRVAVKRLHNVIASDYYHKMIQREMGIAARLRHPKLVLFIGAVTRGNLTIVTELMETSLRSELEHGRLMEVHILPISRDVACALCYLHSLPEPIIHRDVSSANVLLNSRQGGWTAKLGDYGSANFQAKLQTVGPGCPVYAAPEASRPEEQGPKMDVYSYGVLILEMCTGTLPDPRDLPVIQQAVHSWGQPKRQLGELACQCTLKSSDGRPHMRTMVTQLNGM